jgi:hypothetical protein
MITINTNKTKPIYNDRFKLIGDYVIYLTIQFLEMDTNNVTATGYYYYINENNEVVKLKDTKTFMLWDTVSSIETILNPINVLTLRDAVLQRVREFTLLKLTEESGENFGTTIEDWE